MSGSGRPDEETTAGASIAAPRKLSIHPTTRPRGLRLVGDLSRGHTSQLAAVLAGEAEPTGDLTLDLSAVSFIDSAGVQAIASAAEERFGRGRLVLASADPWVHKVLLLAGVDKLPNIHLKEPST